MRPCKVHQIWLIFYQSVLVQTTENFNSKQMFGNQTFYMTEVTMILSTKVMQNTTELLPAYTSVTLAISCKVKFLTRFS